MLLCGAMWARRLKLGMNEASDTPYPHPHVDRPQGWGGQVCRGPTLIWTIKKPRFSIHAYRLRPPEGTQRRRVRSGRTAHFMRNTLAHANKGGKRMVSAFIGTAFAQEDARPVNTEWRSFTTNCA